jgi:hypothetical protein
LLFEGAAPRRWIAYARSAAVEVTSIAAVVRREQPSTGDHGAMRAQSRGSPRQAPHPYACGSMKLMVFNAFFPWVSPARGPLGIRVILKKGFDQPLKLALARTYSRSSEIGSDFDLFGAAVRRAAAADI